MRKETEQDGTGAGFAVTPVWQRVSGPGKAGAWRQRAGLLAAGLTCLLGATGSAHADIVGSDAFLQGTYVEVGIGVDGAFGSDSSPPAGFHPRGGGGLLGFVSDDDKDGWNTDYVGDFFLPGSPEEGWGVRVNGANYNNNNVISPAEIPGGLSNFLDTTTEQSVDWSGSIDGLQIDKTISILKSDIGIQVDVTLTNTSAGAMTDVYYMRNVDPDNNQPLNGSYTTTNSIIAQGDGIAGKARVQATQPDPEPSVLVLTGAGTNARVTHGGFGNRDPVAVWNGSGLNASGTVMADAAISLAFKYDSIGAGDSVSFSYSYNLAEANAPTIDLDADDSSGAVGNSYQAAYTGSAIAVSDADTVIADSDHANAAKAGVQVESALSGDILSVAGALPAGISVDASSTDTKLILVGNASLADYETAIEQIRFDNSGGWLSAQDRQLAVQVVDPDGNPSAESHSTIIARKPDLTVAVSDTPDPVVVGGTITYEILVTNNGDAEAANVAVASTLPSGTSLDTSSGCAEDPSGAPTCSLGTIAAGGTDSFILEVSVPPDTSGGTVLTYNASASTDSTESDTGNNSGSASTTTQASADLSVTKNDSSDPAVAGTQFSYTVEVSNAGPSDAEGVVVNDTLPAGLTLVSTSGCTEDPGGVPGCSLGAVTAGTSAAYTITVSVDPGIADGTELTNAVTVSATTDDPVPDNNAGSESTIIASRPDLAVSKSDDVDPVVAGEQITYTVNVSNLGPSDAHNVVATDTLPGEASLESTSGCAEDPSGVPGCSLGSIAAGGSAAYSITVTVDPGAAEGSTLSNSVSVSADGTDPNGSNDTAVETTGVGTSADLSVVKVDASDLVIAGTQIVYTVTVDNAGPSDAMNVVATDVLPDDVTLDATSGCAGDPSGVPACSLGTVAAGGTAVYTITADVDPSVPAGTTLINSVSVDSDTSDPDGTNNADQEDTTVDTSSDLAVFGSDSADPVEPGAALSYTLDVVNLGPSTATGVVVVDDLPPGVNLNGVEASQGTCTKAIEQLSCTLETLLPGAEAVVIVDVTTVEPEILSNSAQITGDPGDPVPGNNGDTETTLVGWIGATPQSLTHRIPFAGGREALGLTIDNSLSPISMGFAVEELYASLPNDATGPLQLAPLQVPASGQWAASAQAWNGQVIDEAYDGPLAPGAGEVVGSFGTGLRGSWGAGFDMRADSLWVGSIGLGGGDDQDHRFLSDGTSTGESISILPFMGVFAADMTYDVQRDRLWQVNVGGDGCIHELDTVALVPTGESICPAFGTDQRGLAHDPLSDTFYSGSWNDGVIHQFDRDGNLLRSVAKDLPISGLAYNPVSDHLFVMLNTDASNEIHVLDAGHPDLPTAYSFQVTSAGKPVFDDFAQAGLSIDCGGDLWAVNQATNTVYEIALEERGFCDLGDIPWLEVRPSEGSVTPLATRELDVIFDTAGQAPGRKLGRLTVIHDTPYEMDPVPVEFTVGFTDVAPGSFADDSIHTLAGAAITYGCAQGEFCPNASIMRRHMAVWLVRAHYGPRFPVPAATGLVFEDVAPEDFGADEIEFLFSQGVVAGCSAEPRRYCPDRPVTRGQLAVFQIRTKEGPDYTPPACQGVFDDVACSNGFAPWIEELFARGITAGCATSPPRFCPGGDVTRAQMAVFSVENFKLEPVPTFLLDPR